MLTVRHMELADANAYVTEYHRHHKAVRGHRFSLACYEAGRLCGVAIVGRPRSRWINQRTTVEVLRLCTDGTQNACSKLYGACRRAAKAYHLYFRGRGRKKPVGKRFFLLLYQ